MSARERALRAAAAAAGAAFKDPGPDHAPDGDEGFTRLILRERVPNLAAGRGDVIKVGKHHSVVLKVEWRDPSWAVTYSNLIEKGGRLSSADPVTTFLKPSEAPTRLGRWTGRLEPGSSGSVENPVPSEQSGSNVQTRTTTTASKEAKEDGAMPTIVKPRSTAAKSGAKSPAKPAKGAAAKSTTKPAKTAGTQIDYASQVPAFRQHLQGGGTMRALKEQLGVSADTGIRAALYRAGFDSKGNPHGETAGSVNVGTAKGKQRLLALRGEGAGWYRLAFLTGKSEAEVKTLVAEAGGPTTRVYKAPAAKPAASNGTKGKSAAKAEITEASARKGTGKQVTRRAVKANPSKKG